MLISNNGVPLYQQVHTTGIRTSYFGITVFRATLLNARVKHFSTQERNTLRSSDKSSLRTSREAQERVGKLKFPRRKFSMEEPCRCCLLRYIVVFLKFYVIARSRERGSVLHGPKTELFGNLPSRKTQMSHVCAM